MSHEAISNVEPICGTQQIDALTWDFDVLRLVRNGVSKIPDRQWQQPDSCIGDVSATLVLAAIADPRWDWRTIDGIVRSTHLDSALVETILSRNISQIETTYSVTLNKPLFRLRNRKKSPRQLFYDALNTILDILSLGKRPIVQP
jgi:hypothetical protein